MALILYHLNFVVIAGLTANSFLRQEEVPAPETKEVVINNQIYSYKQYPGDKERNVTQRCILDPFFNVRMHFNNFMLWIRLRCLSIAS